VGILILQSLLGVLAGLASLRWGLSIPLAPGVCSGFGCSSDVSLRGPMSTGLVRIAASAAAGNNMARRERRRSLRLQKARQYLGERPVSFWRFVA
jgi:hypothetical protein